MTVSSTTDTSATSSVYQSLTNPTTTKTTSKTDDAQSRFLTLLTAQLKNQDPTNPVDSAQTTSQLAQISTVDGITQLNATMKTLMSSYQSSQTLQAAALVGQQILVDGNQMNLQSGYAVGGFNLSAPADKVSISIRDGNNVEVANEVLSNQDSGIHSFAWDGTTTNGSVAADGKYTMTITASKGTDSITSTAEEMATVTSVANGDSGVSINAGRFSKLGLSDIRSII
ncbi:MAG: flgD [Rhodocyclales bacterium]|nr:flgD [Rhodocyclales bacterium]